MALPSLPSLQCPALLRAMSSQMHESLAMPQAQVWSAAAREARLDGVSNARDRTAYDTALSTLLQRDMESV